MRDGGAGADVLPFPPEYRASGLLLHVTSLPSAYGIGDLGPAAFAWVDRLHEAGQGWWQGLPVGPTGYGDSPYQSLSTFAGNGLLISPEGLIEDELLRVGDCAGRSFSATAVEYETVVPFKLRLLETAWTRFRGGARADLRPAYEQFCQDRAPWLEDYALFRALRAKYHNAYYLEWPADLVRRTPAALDRARRELADQIEQVRFAQFLLLRQAERLKQHARSRGVRLIGDLPFFVSPDSSDVWANPELFVLDKEPGFLPTTSARTGSSGVTRSMTGTPWAGPVIAGGSTAFAPCWLTSTRFGSIISAPLPRPGTCRPGPRLPGQANGCRARAPLSSRPCRAASARCPSSPRIWG